MNNNLHCVRYEVQLQINLASIKSIQDFTADICEFKLLWPKRETTGKIHGKIICGHIIQKIPRSRYHRLEYNIATL